MKSISEQEVTQLSDQALALAARRGDKEARNTLYLCHQGDIEAMVIKARKLAAAAWKKDCSLQSSDVNQQAFIIFCHLLDTWPAPDQSNAEPFLSYMGRLMPAHALRYVRRALHLKAAVRVVKQAPTQSYTLPFDRQVEDQIESALFWQQHVTPLSQPSKRYITLKYNHLLTTRQIAILTGYSPRTIDRHVRSALASLRQDLLDQWEHCA